MRSPFALEIRIVSPKKIKARIALSYVKFEDVPPLKIRMIIALLLLMKEKEQPEDILPLHETSTAFF